MTGKKLIKVVVIALIILIPLYFAYRMLPMLIVMASNVLYLSGGLIAIVGIVYLMYRLAKWFYNM